MLLLHIHSPKNSYLNTIEIAESLLEINILLTHIPTRLTITNNYSRYSPKNYSYRNIIEPLKSLVKIIVYITNNN